DKYRSLVHVLDQACTQFGQRYAFQCMGAAITYQEFDHYAQALAAWLQADGLKKGDRVALMMPNLLQYPVALYAVLRAGGVVVGTNPLYTPAELEHQLRDSGATTIIIAENFAATLEPVIARTQVKRVVVTGIGDLLGGVKGWATNMVVRHVKRLVPRWS